jgi:hypothetical protein
MEVSEIADYQRVVEEICDLDWEALSQDDLRDAAWAYYFFSVQFRENLQIARKLHPADQKLKQLEQEECDTDNLSPWPGVAMPGERMNHDEFMKRTLQLSPISELKQLKLEEIGQSYLNSVRDIGLEARALSIASYEDGGLEKVFRAFLRARHWESPLLQAFKHFLTEHIRFDSDPGQGHGALSRHLTPDDRILPLWTAFKQILIQAVPKLA